MKELIWESKVWGKTRCVCWRKKYSRHELELDKGGYCSFHYHEHRDNDFFLEAGLVRVVWSRGWKIESTVLYPGWELTVAAGVAHQFQVLEDSLLIEEYYSTEKVREDDIVRLSIGGKDFPFEQSKGVIGPVGNSRKIWTGWEDD